MNQFEAAVLKATNEGHILKNDPPANSLSGMCRKTCEVCGRAVLGNYSTSYGGATESPCNDNNPVD